MPQTLARGALDLRLRVTSPELLALPWRHPLAEWDVTRVDFRDIPVGPSRHLVRFVEADGELWALKALPARVARREYDVLRWMEGRSLSAVRAAGIVLQPFDDAAILVTRYLERSWQYRRLLLRLPAGSTTHRARLFDAMAGLLVDLHRNGIYWGDCSLANTLFMRDGQRISAWMVDAETAEVHPVLSDGQRRLDLEIMAENVAGGLLDVAARRGEAPAGVEAVLEESHGVATRYDELWQVLFDEPLIDMAEQHRIGERLRDLNDLGFEVDEVRLEPSAAPSTAPERDLLRMKVAIAGRRFHTDQLRALTGLEVGEGQATILLNDLRAHRDALRRELGQDAGELVAARRWLVDRFMPGVEAAFDAVDHRGDPVQAYCDLLEVRWLLSEAAGHDIGDAPALEALSGRIAPDESAATMAFVDEPTQELPIVPPTTNG